MNTISAGDFTVELDITAEMYQDYMENFFEPIGSKQKEEKEDDALLSPRILIRKRGNDPIRNLGKKPGRFLFKMLVGAKGGEGALLLGLVSCVNTYWKEVSYHTSVLVDMQNLGATGTAFGMIAMKRLSMSSTASPTSLLTLTLTLTLMGGGSS